MINFNQALIFEQVKFQINHFLAIEYFQKIIQFNQKQILLKDTFQLYPLNWSFINEFRKLNDEFFPFLAHFLIFYHKNTPIIHLFFYLFHYPIILINVKSKAYNYFQLTILIINFHLLINSFHVIISKFIKIIFINSA